MNAKDRIIFKEVLLLIVIGFVVHFLIIIGGFIGSYMGITSEDIFDSATLVLVILGGLSFGVCSYFTCFKSDKKLNNKKNHTDLHLSV